MNILRFSSTKKCKIFTTQFPSTKKVKLGNMNNKNTNRTPPCDSSKKVYHLINYNLSLFTFKMLYNYWTR